MSTAKTELLHPRNPHRGRYDFERLCQAKPDLQCFVHKSPRGDDTIDFADAKAVLCLNGAILAAFYGVQHWALPDGYLCPPIPGRADYIHYLADVLASMNGGEAPKGKQVRVLDVGTGANCIYPILGSRSYGWRFVGSDIDPVAVNSATAIVQSNTCLKSHIELRLQSDKAVIFGNVISADETYSMTMCNPPFHASEEQAQRSNQQKRQNLSKQKVDRVAAKPNFSGTAGELWYPGGEIAFLQKMARESAEFASQVGCFSSLLSKSENVTPFKKTLDKVGAKHIEVVPMRQGQKISRFVAWRFSA